MTGRTCPACRAPTLVPIVYGLPAGDLIEQVERGEVALGGSIVGGDDPELHCASCSTKSWRDSRYLIEDGTGTETAQAVPLLHHEGPGIEVTLWAEARADGSVVVAGQDVGPRVEQIWGDSDYEYWLTIGAGDVLGLARAFDTSPEPQALLEALRAAYEQERFRGTSDLQRWLAERDVATEFSSYA